jgi:hypothetical protein
MSAMIDQFCTRLRDSLTAVETRLKAAAASVRTFPGKAEQGLHDDLAAARLKVDGQLAQVGQAREGVKAWAAARLTETREAVAEWKAKRETQKLNGRSDRAESYAADAIFLAAAAVDEAEAAIREAAVAHLDAETARSAPRTT